MIFNTSLSKYECCWRSVFDQRKWEIVAMRWETDENVIGNYDDDDIDGNDIDNNNDDEDE